jgi:hypothetical protein
MSCRPKITLHPGVPERLFVDVRAVDLDTLGAVLDSQRLGEGDDQRICLFTVGTSRAPHPDLARGVSLGNHVGHNLVLQVIPGFRISEEARHVDEDRVEKLSELPRSAGKQRRGIYIFGATGLVHPLADPAS